MPEDAVADRSLRFPAFCNALRKTFSVWTKLLICRYACTGVHIIKPLFNAIKKLAYLSRKIIGRTQNLYIQWDEKKTNECVCDQINTEKILNVAYLIGTILSTVDTL